MAVHFSCNANNHLFEPAGFILPRNWIYSFLFGRQNASDLSAQIIEQTSNRIDLRIRALLDVARSQSQINKKLVNTGQLRASDTNQNEPLTSEDFPAISDYFLEVMKVHKELAYLSLAIEATGEYCMLEQKHDSITSRRYIRNAENQIEIHDYEYSDNGEIKYKFLIQQLRPEKTSMVCRCKEGWPADMA